MTAKLVQVDSINAVLAAAGRSLEIPESADGYGWLVGSWELDVLHYRAIDVSARGIKGEVHAGWVLEGRAVQDVWIMPRRSDRTAHVDKKMNMCGTTLRVWDPTIQAWRIRWRNPGRGSSRRIDWPLERQGCRADWCSTGWHADAVAFH